MDPDSQKENMPPAPTSIDTQPTQPIQPAQDYTPQPKEPENKSLESSSTVEPKKRDWVKIILLVLIPILFGIMGVLGYQNYQLNQKLKVQMVKPVETNTPTPSPTPTPDPTAGWERYTNDVNKVMIMHPSNYSADGVLAESLETWSAGEGIAVKDENNTAIPRVFIETVFDGYGPWFLTGTINAKFVNNKLVINSIDKITDAEYVEMVGNNYISDGNEWYMSEIIEHNDIPYQFQITHNDKGNTVLEEELVTILSTFQILE